MSGSLPTMTMSPSLLARYASIALAVDVERCWMFVTPSAVRSERVCWIETADTSAIGTTPTTKSAARTFCQKRGRSHTIPCLQHDPPVVVFGHSANTQARARVTRAGAIGTGRGLVPGRLADSARAAPRVAQQAAKQALRGLEIGPVGVGQTTALRIDAPPALEAPEALVADAQARNARARAARVARFEVEEALKERLGAAAVGLSLAAVEEDDARRARAYVVRWTWPSSAPSAA